jgi:thioesterase domain-containing protein
MCYYPIATAMADKYDTFAFTAFDHHNRENLSIDQLGTEYHDTLNKNGLTSGLVLAGWSMGALIALDIAAKFASENKYFPVILADQPVPNPENNKQQSYENRLLAYLEKIEIFTGQEIKQHINFGDKIDYAFLLKEFVRLNLVPEEVSFKDFKSFLDILVKHNDIICHYEPPVYNVPVLLLKASEKLMLKTNNPQPEYFLDDLGWGKYCPSLTIADVPGNHINMMGPENAAAVASCIEDWIKSLSGRGV